MPDGIPPEAPPRSGSLGWTLLALLPLLVVAGLAVTEVLRTLRANEQAQMLQTAEVFAASVDARLGAYVAAMTTLSLAPALLREDNHESFHERAVAVGAALGGGVLLLGPAPDFILHASSDVPLNQPLPNYRREGDWTALDALAARVARTGQPAISDLLPDMSGGSLIIAILVPILRDGEMKGMVGFTIAPGGLFSAISTPGRDGPLFAGLTDSQGRIIIQTRGEAGPRVGSLSAAWSTGRMGGQEHGVIRVARTDGTPTSFAFRRLGAANGWVVFVGQTTEAQHSSETRLISWILAALLALALGAGLLASAHRREALRLALQEAAALRAGRAQVERLLGGLPAVIFLRDVSPEGDSRLLYRNGDIEAVTGWPAETLRDRDKWDALYAPGTSQQAFFKTVMRTGSRSGDWRMIQPDGSHRAMRTHGRRLTQRPDGGGEMVGYVLNVDAELSAAARAAAAGRLAALGEMAAGIAHELKQPLQSISLLAENALIRAERGGTEKLSERLEQIVAQTGHAGEIIENLRRFARGTPDGAEPVPVDLGRVVQQTLSLAEAALRGAVIAVDLRLGEPAPVVMGHAVGIGQTLLNLIINARDAMEGQPPGMKRHIVIGAKPAAEGWVMLTLSDTGGGIPPAILARLFEPFVSSKGADKGTGLGLSISHGLIKAMGGRIEAHNGPEGAVFTITLRAAPAGVVPA